jgi:signal recognition particle subunit SRP19
MRQQDKAIIWPAYFDAAKTRKDGRRVAKNLAVLSPKASEIKEAAESFIWNVNSSQTLDMPRHHG